MRVGPANQRGATTRLLGSFASGPAIVSRRRAASMADRVKVVTQSSERHAGTTPAFGMRPREGFMPTRP